ncbi:hypothetical protein JWZ98_11225 [Methylomonas sp. EFPC1]|uniref:hypothetical protein n=1 Tax=Methylomonas sp. EFPC1 TaxID=2812647 RepID=UPI001967843E|nr:hypothetical protein [Methylomonas sp. EFPC1]QSB03448.1 hypothetical protein JWZ98_11225 [Methylomonas sp. EFPC1]
MTAAVDRDKAIHALWKRGTNLKKWAKAEGYGYRNASNVIRGTSRAHFGQGREIAEKLNKLIEETSNV